MKSSSWTLYVLRCRDGSLYTGITNDLEARVAAHNAGKGARYTRSRGPVEVVFSRSRQTPRDARRLEAAVKRLGKAEKEALVGGDERVWRRLRSALR